ncbi:MFS transporter [Liquorilactobacillus ghanensis]|uniref:MFS transporter n=1 Tax=Liquorilactobacillus ghanensis TaxID=399370 RepID=UPI0039EAC6E5
MKSASTKEGGEIIMLKLLRIKQFRYFFLADIISGFGVGLTTVGANWYLLSQTKSSKLVGLYLTVNVIAGFAMSPLAGSLTDKCSRKIVILWSFLGRALPMLLIAGYFLIWGFNLYVMYFLASLTGAGWITYMSASRSYIQSIIPEKLLGSANSFVEVSLQVGMFVAGAISGVILNYTGFLAILVINIIMFLIGTVLIMRIPKDVLHFAAENDVHASFINGIRYIFSTRIVVIVGALSILPLLVTQLFNVTSPAYVASVLNQNSIVYGMADMLYGIGGLTAGILTGWIISKLENKKIIIAYFFLASLALVSLYAGRNVFLMYICTYVIGLSNSSLRIVTNTVLMKNVAASYMGRTTSVLNGTAQFIEIFASSWMGIMNDQQGASFGFLIMFIIMLIGLLLSVLVKRMA